MKRTNEFRELSRIISELRKSMLPSTFDPTGNYSSRWHDRTRGFLLLCHAEIENYLENQCRKIILLSMKKWKQNRETNIILFSLILSYKLEWNINKEIGFQEYLELINAKNNKIDLIDELLNHANKKYISKIKDNNGIKEDNLKTLLIPIGIDFKELDELLLVELTNYGENRGKYAHNSKKTVSLLDPKTEYNSIKQLLALLKKLDEKFFELEQIVV